MKKTQPQPKTRPRTRTFQVYRTFTLYPGDLATLRVLAGAGEGKMSAVVRHLIRRAGGSRPQPLTPTVLAEIRADDEVAGFAKRMR